MHSGTIDTVDVELGDHTVPVPADGLFARYRMDTPLDVVAQDPRVKSLDFFRKLSRTRVDSRIGPTLTPNYYYAMSKAQITFAAPTAALRRRLPGGLDPLTVVPGVGLFSVVFFRYDVCDIDFYTEAAVGIAVKEVSTGGLSPLDLATGLSNDHLHSYVLSLPVNTEIAQVRGHDGYGFPKWVTDIEVEIDDHRTTARVANDTGGTDIALEVATPKQKRFASGESISTLTSYTELDGGWNQTLSQTNNLALGKTVLPRGVELRTGSGRLSNDIRSLNPLRAVRLDVSTDCQNALHIPVPIAVPSSRK